MTELYAHVDVNDEIRIQSVEEHLNNVAKLAVLFGDKRKIKSFCELCALLHDIGKVSEDFQIYMKKIMNGEKVIRGSVNHASAGAHYLLELLSNEDDTAIAKTTITLLAEIVVSHHGLKDFVSPSGQNIFLKTCVNTPAGYDQVMEYINQKVDVDKLKRLYHEAVEEIGILIQEIYEVNQKRMRSTKDAPVNAEIEEQFFDISILLRFLLSILIHADREDTRAFMLDLPLPKQIDTQPIWDKAIDRLEKKLATFSQKDDLSKMRTMISDQCKEAAGKEPGIYRLSCPTGSGKTLASMRYALYHAKKYNKQHIFYIAPYKSTCVSPCFLKTFSCRFNGEKLH